MWQKGMGTLMNDTPLIYVTDDPYTSEVLIRFGLDRKLITTEFRDGESHYHLNRENVQKLIELGIKEGLVRVHLELGENYYHPTAKGMSILKCTCCGGERFEDDECENPQYIGQKEYNNQKVQ